MDERRIEELAREALAESERNDCELVGVRAAGGGAWRIELMDVMLKREVFSVNVRADESSPAGAIKDSIRRCIAEHYSIESY